MKKFIFIILLISAGAFFANGKEPAGPMKIKNKIKVTCEEGMELDSKGQTVTFVGSVELVSDNLLINCEKLNVSYSEIKGKKDISTMSGSGNVICVEKTNKMRAESEKFVYDRQTGLMTFTSPDLARVIMDDNELTGKKIIFDVNKEEIISKGKTVLEINLDELPE